MKRDIITIFLLFIMTLYAVHGLFFTVDHHDHSVVEYIEELDSPTSHGDSCDLHFVFHQVFLLPQVITICNDKQLYISLESVEKIYYFKPYLEHFKPPIA